MCIFLLSCIYLLFLFPKITHAPLKRDDLNLSQRSRNHEVLSFIVLSGSVVVQSPVQGPDQTPVQSELFQLLPELYHMRPNY